MPNSYRIYYAVHACALSPESSTTYTAVHGVQSVGMTTTFNLEQVFELGQLAIYENIENIPDIEMTIERVLDGYPLAYHLATRGSANRTLGGSSTKKCNAVLAIFGDTQNSASGTPVYEVYMSGMYVSALTYTLPVDGNCTESVTLVGNNRVWRNTGIGFPTGVFLNNDAPAAMVGTSGGVQRRENVLFGSKLDGTVTLLPSGTNGIPGISSSGTNNLVSDVYGAHIQGITISTNLGRESINELGRRGPYYRYATFPVEVTCEIEVLSTQGDLVSATEEGSAGGGTNLLDQRILVVLSDSTKFDLGTKNKLSSVSYTGGDTGGGNVSNTFSYSNFNDLTITQNNDPG